MTHAAPAHIDQAALRKAAARRRQALVAAGCSTYVVRGFAWNPAIVCLCCSSISHNINDVEAHYCDFCKEWHSEERPE